MSNSIPILLNRRQVEQRLSVFRSFIYDHMRDGRFPRPIRIGAKAVRWRVEDINRYVQERAAQEVPQ